MENTPMTERTREILQDTTESLIIETIKSVVEIKKDIKLAKTIKQFMAKDDIPIDIDNTRKLLEFRMFIGFLMLDFASAMRVYLNSKLQYEGLFSARQIIAIIYEGYKKIYNFLNTNKDGELLKFRHDSFWIKNIGPIITNDFPDLQKEFDYITESLDNYLKVNFALVKKQRNLSIHYDYDPMKVYEMLLKLDIEDTYKKLIPFLNILIRMSTITKTISYLYKLKNDSLKIEQERNIDSLIARIEQLKNAKNKDVLHTIQQNLIQLKVLNLKQAGTMKIIKNK